MEYVRHAAPVYGIQRALYDGFAMSFQTLLKAESAEALERLMTQHLLRGAALKVRRKTARTRNENAFVILSCEASRRVFLVSRSFSPAPTPTRNAQATPPARGVLFVDSSRS